MAEVPREIDFVRARLWRVRLPVGLELDQVLKLVDGQPYPLCLVGAWADGSALVSSAPLRVAQRDSDPFELLASVPEVDDPEVDDPEVDDPEVDDPEWGAVGGGWFGWLGYRLAQRVEQVPLAEQRPVPLPEFHLAYYDNVLRRDPDGVWWFEALVTPERQTALRARLKQLLRALPASSRRSPAKDAAAGVPTPLRLTAAAGAPAPLRLSAAAARAHLSAVGECRERIAAGEIFQANICLRLESEYDGTAIALLRSALSRNPHLPQYTAAFDTPDAGVLSLSPELFLRRQGRRVRSGPIKGTVARVQEPGQATRALAQLRASSKDAAEHVMIVDLMRNDLGRVSQYGTVTAPRRPTAEGHPGLWHLVSNVEGTLRPGVSDADLLRATFPPGSVTGAPKVQSLIVIAELEATGREIYTGAIGFVSPLAGLELNVAIRTLEFSQGRLWLGVGGGIVADSEPAAELAETLVKARPVADAVGTVIAFTDQRPAR
ncbi:MAG: chorismate-binding protein [Solirubrobacteraceae bacterium]